MLYVIRSLEKSELGSIEVFHTVTSVCVTHGEGSSSDCARCTRDTRGQRNQAADAKMVPVVVPVLPPTGAGDYAKLALELHTKLSFGNGDSLEPDVKAKYEKQLEHCELILERWGTVKPWYKWPVMDDELLRKEFNDALTSSRLGPPHVFKSLVTTADVEPVVGVVASVATVNAKLVPAETKSVATVYTKPVPVVGMAMHGGSPVSEAQQQFGRLR